MQIGANPVQLAAGEDAPKPLWGEHAGLSTIEAPDAEAFGDLMQGIDDPEEPDAEGAEILLSQAASSFRAATPKLPNMQVLMDVEGRNRQSAPVPDIVPNIVPDTGLSGNETPVSGRMNVGLRAPAIEGETSEITARAVQAQGANEHHDTRRTSERKAEGRKLSNVRPPSMQLPRPAGDSPTEKANSPSGEARIGAIGAGGHGAVPQVADAVVQGEHANGQDGLMRTPKAPDVAAKGGRDEFAEKLRDDAGVEEARPHRAVSLKERGKMTAPAPEKKANTGIKSERIHDAGQALRAPEAPRDAAAPLEMHRQGLVKPHDEARNEAAGPVAASGQQFSKTGPPASGKSGQKPLSRDLTGSSSGNTEQTGRAAFHQQDKGEQMQAGSLPDLRNGESRGSENTRADRADAPAAGSVDMGEAVQAVRPGKPLKKREIFLNSGSGRGNGMADGDHFGGSAGPEGDAGILRKDNDVSDGSRETHPRQPVSEHRPMRRGNLPAFPAGDSPGVPKVENPHDGLNQSLNTLMAGNGPHSSVGPDTLREVAGVARGHAPPHLPVAERHVIQQVAQAAVQIADRPIELRLDPEELGRVRLVMTMKDNNAIAVSIHAERPETLDLMRRNINELTQEFRDLGYGNSEFSFGSGMSDQRGRGEAMPVEQTPLADLGAEAKADAAMHRPRPAPLVLEISERLDLRL